MWPLTREPWTCKYDTYIFIVKGIVHFEIKIWYLSAYPKGIQDVGVFFSSVDPILMFLGQTVLGLRHETSGLCEKTNSIYIVFYLLYTTMSKWSECAHASGVWRVCVRALWLTLHSHGASASTLDGGRVWRWKRLLRDPVRAPDTSLCPEEASASELSPGGLPVPVGCPVCLAPEGSWYPLNTPGKFGGGFGRKGAGCGGRAEGTEAKAPKTTCHGLLSSQLHHGLQSAHPPPPPPRWNCYGVGHAFREGGVMSGFCCVSSVPASCVHIWFVSCPRLMSLWVKSVPAVFVSLCVNYPLYISPVFWVWFSLVYLWLPGVSCLSVLPWCLH